VAGLVDWRLAERVAIRIAGTDPFASSYHASSYPTDAIELTSQAEQLVTETTGLVPLGGPARARVVDRPAWIRANIASLQRLLAPVLERFDAATPKAAIGRRATSAVAGAEIGALLGWMSGRVLGQYDLLVVDAADATDQDIVYYVGPNVLSLEKRFGFPPREFRLWLALHEVTHRAQFTGVPWMREHYLGLVHDLMTGLDPDPQQLATALKQAVTTVRNQGRRALDDGGIAALLAAPAQREAMARIGGLMSLLEGHGDVTMDRAGAGHVPSAERFARVLRARREQRAPLVKFVQKITGLEAKLAQYQQGEAFIAAIEAVGGPRVVDRCWAGPSYLPSLDEIRAPNDWLARVGVVPVG
jgi:coenzyme F420 biosynthesis associated uncharacterized protein